MESGRISGWMQSVRRFRRYFPLVAAVCAVLPFLPSLGYGFLYEWDDANFILDNPYIGMSWANLLHNFTTNLQTVYTPLTTFSLMIDHALFGTWAPGYHAVQLLMLGGCAALLFLILRKLRVPASAALLLTLLWAWNPGKCETAAWIADRKGMGCTLFALAAFLSFLRDCRREKAGAGTVLLMFAAFLFKPSALPLPGVMALYAWCRFPGEWGKLFRLLWPVGAAGIAGGALVSAMTFSELSGSHASGIADAANLLRYFGGAVWPFSLNPIHPRLTLPEMLPELLWAAAVLAAVIWAGRKSRVPGRFQMAFATGFVFLALPLLSSGALTNSNYAERYNFLLSAAAWCWIGVAGRGLFRRLPRVSAWAAGILLAGYLLTDWFYLETFSDTPRSGIKSSTAGRFRTRRPISRTRPRAKTTNGRICMRDLRKPRGRRASPKWLGCSTQWRRSRRNTRNGIKSCFPTWKTGWYFPRTATRFGSAPTADISSSAKTRPSSAPSARIPKAISRYAPKIIDF